MTDHYKAGDALALPNGMSVPLKATQALIANAARQEAFAEIDAAAEACGLDGDTRTIYFFDGERYNNESGPFPEVKAWGVELYKDAGVEHFWGDTLTAALLAASKGEGDE